jgi:hypothetical protein
MASVVPVASVGGSKLVNIPAWKFDVPSGTNMECEGRNRSRKASGGIGPRIKGAMLVASSVRIRPLLKSFIPNRSVVSKREWIGVDGLEDG